jgi:hypothetical protein
VPGPDCLPIDEDYPFIVALPNSLCYLNIPDICIRKNAV